MRQYVIERTDECDDHIMADSCSIEDKVIYFVKKDNKNNTYTYISYVLSNVIKIVDLGEVKEEEQSEEPERRKNDNEDLISRSGLLNFLRTHWSGNIIDVIQTFEKAEYLD